ncbi:hypothetical protein V2J09_006873 [Rumex salicifolius]
MFGRVRASPLPVEFLELERLPSKMLKDDSLSVYEATILKLKQGSRKTVSSPEEMVDRVIQDSNQSSAISGESMSSDLSSVSEGAITESSSETFSSTERQGITYVSDSDSSISTTKESRNMSIQYLFSKYKQSSYHLKEKGLQNDELMDTEEESLTDNSTLLMSLS